MEITIPYVPDEVMHNLTTSSSNHKNKISIVQASVTCLTTAADRGFKSLAK